MMQQQYGGGWRGGPSGMRGGGMFGGRGGGGGSGFRGGRGGGPPGGRRDRSRSPLRKKKGGGATGEPSDWETRTEMILDFYNSDLNLQIDNKGVSAKPMHQEGFAYMWCGARATYGVKAPPTKDLPMRVWYEVKVGDKMNVNHLPPEESNPHVLRLGWSVDASSLNLGEEPKSWGYGGTGKKSVNSKFENYGCAYSTGDVIGCYLEFETGMMVRMAYTVNGALQGNAYKFPVRDLADAALFPHIFTKNLSFEVNFGQLENPWYPTQDIQSKWTMIGKLPVEQRMRGKLPPEKIEDCEIIMMCGLPGAGKTYWAEKHVQTAVEKRYTLLGSNAILDKMKVMGLPRKRNYHGRWDVLIEMAMKCLNKFFEIAPRRKRNYVLDQTNVYPNAQRRKMRNFEAFHRKAVVVVPKNDEFLRRVELRTKAEGKEVPEAPVMEMKANFRIPAENDIFEEIIFTELSRVDAEKLVTQYNTDGKNYKKAPPPQPGVTNPVTEPPAPKFRPDRAYGSTIGSSTGTPSENESFSSAAPTGRSFGESGSSDFGGRGGWRGGARGGRGGFRGGFSGGEDRSTISREGSASGMRGGRPNNGDGGGFRGGGFRGGFGGRGGFGSTDDGGHGGFRGGHDGGHGGFRGGHDVGHGGFRGGHDGGHGGFRGGHDGGFRGGHDSGFRGGHDSGHGGFRGGRNGGEDGGHGGFRGGRSGGEDGSHGGFRGGRSGGDDGGHGSFRGGRGGAFGGRGGFGSGHRGGFGRDGGNEEYGDDRRGRPDQSFGGGRGGGGFGDRGGSRGSFGGRGGFQRSEGFGGGDHGPHGGFQDRSDNDRGCGGEGQMDQRFGGDRNPGVEHGGPVGFMGGRGRGGFGGNRGGFGGDFHDEQHPGDAGRGRPGDSGGSSGFHERPGSSRNEGFGGAGRIGQGVADEYQVSDGFQHDRSGYAGASDYGERPGRSNFGDRQQSGGYETERGGASGYDGGDRGGRGFGGRPGANVGFGGDRRGFGDDREIGGFSADHGTGGSGYGQQQSFSGGRSGFRGGFQDPKSAYDQSAGRQPKQTRVSRWSDAEPQAPTVPQGIPEPGDMSIKPPSITGVKSSIKGFGQGGQQVLDGYELKSESQQQGMSDYRNAAETAAYGQSAAGYQASGYQQDYSSYQQQPPQPQEIGQPDATHLAPACYSYEQDSTGGYGQAYAQQPQQMQQASYSAYQGGYGANTGQETGYSATNSWAQPDAAGGWSGTIQQQQQQPQQQVQQQQWQQWQQQQQQTTAVAAGGTDQWSYYQQAAPQQEWQQ